MSIKEIAKLSNGKDLDIKYPISLCDKDGNEVYHENSNGYWQKREYEDGKQTYFEDSYGYWYKNEYKYGKETYYENANGCIEDNREPLDMTMEEVCKLAGRNVRIVK